MDGVCDDRVDVVWGVSCPEMRVRKKLEKKNTLRISPGTGRMRSPMVHSPFVPAFPPIGGRPPTSTTLNTSTNSCTNPDRAREIVIDKALSSCVSRCVRCERPRAGECRAG